MVSRYRLWPGLLSLGVLLFCTAAQAQKALRNDEVSIGGFYQFTANASGNSITDTATKSLGGEAAFSHSFHPLLGWQFSYDYTRFTEKYTGQPFGYQHNLHVFNGDYYLQGFQALGIRPYGMAGDLFSSANKSTRRSWRFASPFVTSASTGIIPQPDDFASSWTLSG